MIFYNLSTDTVCKQETPSLSSRGGQQLTSCSISLVGASFGCSFLVGSVLAQPWHQAWRILLEEDAGNLLEMQSKIEGSGIITTLEYCPVRSVVRPLHSPRFGWTMPFSSPLVRPLGWGVVWWRADVGRTHFYVQFELAAGGVVGKKVSTFDHIVSVVDGSGKSSSHHPLSGKHGVLGCGVTFFSIGGGRLETLLNSTFPGVDAESVRKPICRCNHSKSPHPRQATQAKDTPHLEDRARRPTPGDFRPAAVSTPRCGFILRSNFQVGFSRGFFIPHPRGLPPQCQEVQNSRDLPAPPGASTSQWPGQMYKKCPFPCRASHSSCSRVAFPRNQLTRDKGGKGRCGHAWGCELYACVVVAQD